jgi:hypothetical protein
MIFEVFTADEVVVVITRIVSWNINGAAALLSGQRPGCAPFGADARRLLDTLGADVLCLQGTLATRERQSSFLTHGAAAETKLSRSDLATIHSLAAAPGVSAALCTSRERAGYSGGLAEDDRVFRLDTDSAQAWRLCFAGMRHRCARRRDCVERGGRLFPVVMERTDRATASGVHGVW